MPTYGFEKWASASNKTSKVKEKTLPRIITKPVRLSQLRKTERRGGVGEAGVISMMGQSRFAGWSLILILLLKCSHVRDEAFDVLIRHVFSRFHQNFTFLVFESIFRRLKGCFIGKR